MLRILVCEDHVAFRDGLKRLLETQPGWEIVGEASDGNEVVEKSVGLKPDIVILDHMMPERDGLDAARRIRQDAPEAEIVMLTHHDSPVTVERALKAGVRAYVVKLDAGRELLAAIKAVATRKTFISSSVRASSSAESPQPALPEA